MLLPSLLVAVALAAEPAPRCVPKGLYQASAGFFTRFDGQGHWQTTTAANGPALIGGRYDLDGHQIRFKLAADGETPFDWTATFSDDCRSIVLKYMKGTESDIHFQWVSPSSPRPTRENSP